MQALHGAEARRVLVLLALAALCAVVQSSPPNIIHMKHGVDDGAFPGPYGLLLVTGRVDGSSARILYEGDPTSRATIAGATFAVRVWQYEHGWDAGVPPPAYLRGPPVQELEVVPVPEPRVVVIDQLLPDTRYVVGFAERVDGGSGDEEEKGVEGDGYGELHEVVFSTLAPVSEEPLKMIVVACDRYSQDKDSTLVNRLARDAIGGGGFDVMVHMGDQIYADWLVDKFSDSDYDTVANEFRRLYRNGWTRPGMRRLLRHGSHLMLPDDHDVTDALSEDTWKVHRVFVEVAKRMFYEYQYQLIADIPPRDQNLPNIPLEQAKRETKGVHAFLTMRGTAMALVDLRWQRTFRLSEERPFIGREQMEEFQAAVAAWEVQAGVDRLAVFSAIPLMYQSTFLSRVADWFENEKYSTVPIHHTETLMLLRTLRDGFSGDKLLMAGDLHMSFDSRICSTGGQSCMRQIVTSGLTTSASTLQAKTLVAYSALAIRVLPSRLAEFVTHYADAFVSQNYLVVNVGVPADASRGITTVQEGDFHMRVERLALTPRQRLTHVIHDHFLAVLGIAVATPLLGLLCCCRVCCGQRRRERAFDKKRKLA